MTAELESDLRDAVDWNRMWLVDLNAGKTQLILFDRPIDNGAIGVKMDGSVQEEKLSFNMLGLTFLLTWIGAFGLTLLLKLRPRNFIRSFFLLRLLCISISLPFGLAWNTVVMSGLVLLVATSKC